MKRYLLTFAIIFNVGCANKQLNQPDKIIVADIPIKEHAVLAVLWQQNAAEYRALCHQAFNWAEIQLKKALKTTTSDKPLAIITDIDETILDNSPYSSMMINDDVNYQKSSWITWGKKESAALVPGAFEFLQAANNLGVEIFYLSNRYDEQTPETLRNLKKYNLPDADESHLLLRSQTSGKEDRRKKISNTHEVLLLLGDNLSDFHHAFDDQNSPTRNQLVNKMKHEFGSRFIVFPNPTYGDWETDGIYNGTRSSESEKRATRKQKLKNLFELINN